jgi:hypothetical protein
VHENLEDKGMVYTLDDNQLLGLWTVISQLGVIREMRDPTDRSILLTKAQALLTALVLELSPLLRDRDSSTASGHRPKKQPGSMRSNVSVVGQVRPVDRASISNGETSFQWTICQLALRNPGSS